jgi:hypothetical protein
MRRIPGVVLVVLLALAGCARHASEQRPASRLTEAQRDTAIARSSLPGASTVGRALDVSGQGAGHAAQLDSLTRR